MADYNARATGGLTTGIIGTSLGVLNSGMLGNLFGGNCGCGDNAAVTRYELGMEKSLAAKDSEISLLKSTIHTDGKMLEMYQYVDGRLRGIEGQIAQQAVVNAQVAANLSCMQGNIATLMGLTKTVIPIGNVCPSPMPEFNSWTAPTAGT
jgi:hypothetical protein